MFIRDARWIRFTLSNEDADSNQLTVALPERSQSDSDATKIIRKELGNILSKKSLTPSFVLQPSDINSVTHSNKNIKPIFVV